MNGLLIIGLAAFAFAIIMRIYLFYSPVILKNPCIANIPNQISDNVKMMYYQNMLSNLKWRVSMCELLPNTLDISLFFELYQYKPYGKKGIWFKLNAEGYYIRKAIIKAAIKELEERM